MSNNSEHELAGSSSTARPFSLRGYALAGLAAAGLMSIVELVDVNITLTPMFESFTERLVLVSYYGLNLTGGLLIGLAVGLVVLMAGKGSAALASVGERVTGLGFLSRLGAGLAISALAAFLLNQVPVINRYIIGLIREAEKFVALRDYLLHHERSTSYLILMGLFIASALVREITLRMTSLHAVVRGVWMLALAGGIGLAWFADSRVEVQLYEDSMHKSMFLLNVALSMALAASLHLSIRPRIRASRLVYAMGALALLASLVFTFLYFGGNENLKTQVFFRTTQAKQYVRLARWMLDRDRDGFAGFLGGGDCDDSDYHVSPRQIEQVEDGIDNNCFGGDLKRERMEEWLAMHRSLNAGPRPPQKRHNVIFLFIDALRADVLGAYGYPRNTSPNIDRLAARGTVFENAYTPSPNTYQALPKFMQSSYWDGHFETWTAVLARSGYNALLFPRRIATISRHVKGLKLAHKGKVGPWANSVDIALDVLGSMPDGEPFFAYLYSTDPHRPFKYRPDFDFGPTSRDRYDGEVAYSDHHFGRVLSWLEQTGKIDDTVIVIMADHGESLGERHMWRHSTQLYDEQSRVPMIVYVPGQQPRRVTDYVSTIDLGSTILDSVGIEIPGDYIGVSLMPLIRGEQMARPPVFGEQTSDQVSPYVTLEQNVHPDRKKYMVITQDGFKLIWNREANSLELYDLKSDPREFRNLWRRMPDLVREMRGLLGTYIDVVQVLRPWDADESKYFFGDYEESEEDE